MSQQFYSIQLLNDLHNHFPEILYNPERFQSIQDLFIYIREVASFSPYDRGLLQYNARNNRTNNVRQNVPNIQSYRSHVAPAPPMPADINRMYNVLPVNSTVPQTYVATTIIDESHVPQTTRVRVPINTNTNVLMNTLLSGLFGDILNGSNMEGGSFQDLLNPSGMGDMGPLQDFLNQRVPIRPTQEQINTSSTISRINARQVDICTICQEHIDAGQEMRRITYCGHYFHRDCIDTWFRGNVHCPTCRHDIRDGNSNPPPVPENHRRTNIRRSDN